MADVASLVVRIITEKKGDAGKELTGTAAKVDGVSKKFAKFAVPAAAAGAAVLAFGAAAAKSASRTQQALGAVDSVFGKNAGQIKKWADGAATSVGLAKSEYSELATVIGSQLKNMGLPMDQVTSKTNDLITMGADLAATFGGSTAEAVEALSSTLRGETDPIERYGVSINQAAIAAKMAEDGTAGLTGAAGKQAKTMATLSLITAQTADASGQFAEESDSAAGQAQIASAQFENMKSALGTALLPAIAAVTGVLGTLAAAAAKHPKLFQAIAAVILILAGVVLVLAGAMKIYNLVTAISAAVTSAAWLAALWPILLVVAAVAAVIAVVVLLWKRSQTFRNIVLAVWAAIRTAALAVARAVTAAWRATWNALSAAGRATSAAVRATFNAVRAAAGAVASGVKAVFVGAFNAVRSAARAVGSTIRGAWDGITALVGRVASGIKSAMIGAFNSLRSAASGLASALSAPFNTIKSAVNGVINAVQSLIGWLSRIKVPKISLPKIPGLGRSAAPSGVSTATTAVAGARAAPVPLAGFSSRAGDTGAAVVINVNGALDPEGVARQIRRILNGHGTRVGILSTGAGMP